jgi:outer membrane protein
MFRNAIGPIWGGPETKPCTFFSSLQEEIMKKVVFILGLALLVAVPAPSHAFFGVEAAVGGWRQGPGGHLSYDEAGLAGHTLDLERDLSYDDEVRITGRVKIRTPVFLPNIYLMATRMEADGTGRKSDAFNFGGETFSADEYFSSKLAFNHYDIALYYEFPLLNTATFGGIGIDGGLNARIIDFEAQITGPGAADPTVKITKSTSENITIPMAFIAAQMSPIEKIVVEAEGRGISIGDNRVLSLIGRVKVKAFGPFYGAVGYRYDDIKIDEEGVKADVSFDGPFLEAVVVY